jgi:hypothetical protein
MSSADKILNKIKESLVARADINRAIQAAARVQEKRMHALELFRPFAYQDEFLLCNSTEVLVRGGTRSGKSTVVAASIASYVLNKPITNSFGAKISMREDRFKDKSTGEIWVIGKQMNHSSTIYRLLFQPGAFWIVRDKKTQQWRAWQPGTIEGDIDIPESERKQSPPFIYPGDVEFGWEKVREKQWNTATLPNGWVIKYFPSNGAPKRGDPVHRIWIDEDIENDELYPELQSRLSDFAGRIWWSSWPELNCVPLVALYDRCVDDMADFRAGRTKTCDAYQMAFNGDLNPAIAEEEKRKRAKGWDEATYRARTLGEFNRESIKTYPEFNKAYHVVDYGADDPRNDKVTTVLRATNFVPPSNWCVDLMLDPGTIRPALLWVATPPPDFWYGNRPFHIVYREITGRKDADQLAYYVKHAEPRRVYHRWIIDSKCGDQTSPGARYTVEERYSEAFKKVGLKCVKTGVRFLSGEQSWIVRSMELRKMMQPVTESADKPQLRIVSHMCPELIRQIDRNLRHVSKNDVQDKRAGGQVQDLLDTLEYFAGSHPDYSPPPEADAEETPSFQSWKNEQDRWTQLIGDKQRGSNSTKIVCGIP